MENLWKRAKSFAEEAAKKSQTITTSSASAKISDLVSKTAKWSRKFVAEASKKADEIKSAALKKADQIKSLSISEIIPPQLSNVSLVKSSSASASVNELSPEER